MAWYTAIFLGLVQGLAEFLPISSSGHLLLFEHLCGIDTGGLLFTIVLHVATLLAVVIVYRKRLWSMLRHPWQKGNWQLLVATVVTCGLVLLTKPLFDRLFTFATLPFTFIVAGVVLLLPTIIKWRPRTNRPWLTAVAVGLAQGVAVLPGLTRSGCTMVTGELCGQSKTAAADFSFLLSIPIIVASLAYEIMAGGTLGVVNWGSLSLAFLSALVAGVVAIKWLLNLLGRVDWRGFAIYLMLLGGGLLLFSRGLQMF